MVRPQEPCLQVAKGSVNVTSPLAGSRFMSIGSQSALRIPTPAVRPNRRPSRHIGAEKPADVFFIGSRHGI